MKPLPLIVGITLFFASLAESTFAQVPVLSYSPSTDIYTVNTTITTLSPTNTGGAVSTGALTTFANIPGGTQPYGIAYDPTTGDIITNSFSGGDVYVYSPTGALLHTYTTDIGAGGPKDIIVDNSGNIYEANPIGHDVVKITPSGTFSTITGSPTAMNTPDGMAIDAAGNIYVADQASDIIYKIAPGATTASVYAKGFTDLYGVTVNSSGQVYASEYSSSSVANNVYKVTSGSTTGGTTLLYTLTNASGSNFRNLSIDDSGDIYVADEGLGTIIKLVPGSNAATTTSSIYVTGLTNPRATCFDTNGNTYIANSGGNDVVEKSPANYSIDIPLPAGMSFNTTTGEISGTPTVTSPTTTYTIAGHNASGTGYTTVVITVDPTSPAGTGATVCGSGSGSVSATLTATAGAPAGGTFNWYAAASGGPILASGSTYTPSVSATTTFYVDYSQGATPVTCATRTAVTLTVSATPVISTAPASGAYFSYGFTAGSATDLSGSTNTGTTHGGPTITNDRYGIASNALSFASASTQYISTAKSASSPATFSISAWFNTTGTVGGYIAGFGSSQTGNSTTVDRVVYMGTDNKLYFGVKLSNTTNTTINSAGTFNDGSWHHVVATFSAANGSNMYVDGALVASNPAMNSAATIATGYWRVAYDAITGKWTNAPSSTANTYFNGLLDDVAVANTELTLAQVAVYYGAGSGTFCPGNAISLTANTVAGATYSWAGPSGSGFASSSQNPTVPAANAIAGIYVLTVTSSGGCISIINVTAPANAITYTWTGTTSTSPAVATNWSGGILPPFTSSSNLVIPTGLTNYPTLAANETIYGLTLGATAKLSLNGFTLSVGCNIINSASTSGDGILYGSNNSSGITWNGSAAAQSYTGTNTTNTASLGSMTVNNTAGGTVTINSGPVDVYSLLTITSGNLVVGSSPAALTLKSSATQSANVAAIPGSYSISGNVTVERYLTGGSNYRSYRLISSPVYTATISSTYNVYSLNYLQTGMYLTGNAGGGFDKTGNPTIYLYREDQVPSNATFTSGNFWGVSAINNSPAYNYYINGGSTAYNVPVGNGMMVFFRGNRASASLASETLTSYTTPVTATLSTTGTLNQGTVVVRNWYTPGAATIGYTGSGTTSNTNYAARGFNLVGNPYASSIDWNNFSNSSAGAAIYGLNVGPSVWIFNPHTKNFDTYNANTHISNGSATNIIPSGQGFFVLATNTSPSLTFQEAAKTSTQAASGNLLMDTRVALNTISQSAYGSYMRLRLITDTVNNADIVIGFNSTSTTKYNEQEDAKFMKGSGSVQTLASISSDSVNTSVKWLPFPANASSQVIRLVVSGANYGTYTLQRGDFKNIPSIYNVWLMDNYKKDSLDIRNNTDYVFDITADTNSYGRNRFTIVIRENPALMVHLLNFAATKAVNGSQVVWSTENEQNYTNFTVERSTNNGASFSVMGGTPSSAQGAYSFLDKTPADGANSYRLQITDLNGNITYSNVVTLMYGNTAGLVKTGIMVYPNPAKTTLNLNIAPGFSRGALIAQLSSSSYNIRITNVVGSVIKQASTSQQSWQTDVSSLTPGNYVIQVVNKSNNTVVGQETFVKL